jgi:hypothetical protein
MEIVQLEAPIITKDNLPLILRRKAEENIRRVMDSNQNPRRGVRPFI